MMNPLQTQLTHAEPMHHETGGFPGALARAAHALTAGAEGAGLIPRGRVRVRVFGWAGDFGPYVVGSLIAGGPDLPDPVSVYAEPAHPVGAEIELTIDPLVTAS